MKLPRVFPPIWFLANISLILALRRFMPTPLALPEFHLVAGQVLIWSGVVTVLTALLSFRRHRTTVVPFRNPETLIRIGIFRWSRNPIYLGEAFILAGLCTKFDQALPWLILPLFIIGLNRLVIKWEETTLRTQFGSDYAAYCANTRRWL